MATTCPSHISTALMEFHSTALGLFASLFSLTNGGDGCYNLAQLQLIQDSCLSGRVETHHQNPHLLLAKKALKKASERSHFSLSL